MKEIVFPIKIQGYTLYKVTLPIEVVAKDRANYYSKERNEDYQEIYPLIEEDYHF